MSVSVLTLLPETETTSSLSQIQPSFPSISQLEFSFPVKHNISRLWYIIRDANLTTLLCPDFFFPLIINKGKDTWGIGTEFFGKTTSSTQFNGKCVKYKSFSQIKKLSWLVHHKEQQKYFYYDYTLYKVTADDSSVLLITIRSDCEEDLTRLNEFFSKKNFFEIFFERINMIMNQSCLNLFQFEGVVIEANIEDIWSFLTCFDQLKKIAPLIPIDGESSCQAIPKEIGKEAIIYLVNHSSYIKVKTLKYDIRADWNKWVALFVVTESFPAIPKYETLITVNKINEEECHISWYHDFKEPASSDFLKAISETKKYILKKLQDFLENYIAKHVEEECYLIKDNVDSNNNLSSDNNSNKL